MKNILSTALLALAILPVSAKEKPNFIIFLVDDMGWADVGYNGTTYYQTPHIDQMAKEGMVFTNAYANAANCAPTRACLLSGLYPSRHGVYTVGNPARGKASQRKLIPTPNNTTLASNFTTIAEAMKTNGYATYHIGKWHLGDTQATLPEGQGFDVNIGGNHHGHPKTYFSPYKNPQLKDGEKGEYLTDRLTTEACHLIEQSAGKPFFMYFAHYAVHTPIQAPAELTAKYKNKTPYNKQDNATYAAMVEKTDDSLGRILNKLRELNLDKNTYVIFFSDNGGHGGITDQTPLRGSKGTLYEGGFREPMIVWAPGKVAANSQNNTPVMGFDFFPTLVELAGDKPEKYKLDGESITPLLAGKNQLKRDAIFWHFPAYLEGYRGIKYPEDLTRGFRAVPSSAMRKGDWKLIENFEDGSLQLFNLKEDLNEQHNLAQSHPKKAKKLLKELRKWRAKTKSPVPTKLNPKYQEQ
ncbi:hypothetical protein EMN47_08440 [Prolixibacteraceae bacterium JC049]|nr:hypothetical protein [Prolixibacteraceae bacterium JC049]